MKRQDPTPEQLAAVHRIAAHLCGTCSVNQGELTKEEPSLNGMDEDDVTPWIEQYGEIFLCPDCGWWCENSEQTTHEATGDLICSECAEDR